MLERPRSAIKGLGLLVSVLLPLMVAVTLLTELAWYHGIGLFYATVGIAEIGYVFLLLAVPGLQRAMPLRATS